jgi:hypothetical protein
VKLLCRFVHAAELLTVTRHEHRDFTRRLGKMQQCPVDFLLQVREFREISVAERGAIPIPSGMRFALHELAAMIVVSQVESTSVPRGPDPLAQTHCRRNIVCGNPTRSCV